MSDDECAGGAFCWLGACASHTAVAVGYFHSCALTSSGAIQCWGANYAGQLGDNSKTDSRVPVAVVGMSSGVVAIAVGSTYSCAMTSAGSVLCWGALLGNSGGNPIPVAVSGLPVPAKAISVGDAHACAVTTAGAVYCWGKNNEGQLGDGSMTDSPVAVPVSGLSSGVTAVAAGNLHTCALLASGGVMCWGYGGLLGNNSTMSSPVPVAVMGLSSGVVAIAAGYEDTCAVLAGGALECWGSNTEGGLGVGNSWQLGSNVPVAIAGLSASVVAVGYQYTCAVTSSGGVACWGFNSFGELGDGSRVNSNVPVAVSGLAPDATAIALGESHTCAVVAGRVECWGWNGEGELGNGSTTIDSLTPVSVVEP